MSWLNDEALLWKLRDIVARNDDDRSVIFIFHALASVLAVTLAGFPVDRDQVVAMFILASGPARLCADGRLAVDRMFIQVRSTARSRRRRCRHDGQADDGVLSIRGPEVSLGSLVSILVGPIA